LCQALRMESVVHQGDLGMYCTPRIVVDPRILVQNQLQEARGRLIVQRMPVVTAIGGGRKRWRAISDFPIVHQHLWNISNLRLSFDGLVVARVRCVGSTGEEDVIGGGLRDGGRGMERPRGPMEVLESLISDQTSFKLDQDVVVGVKR
jgi:hypothetical protein